MVIENMKQTMLLSPRDIQFSTEQAPTTVGENEVLIKIRKIGICGSDIHAYNGKQLTSLIMHRFEFDAYNEAYKFIAENSVPTLTY